MKEVLQCPNCEGYNLHQKHVDVYFRKEDNEQGIHTYTNINETDVTTSMEGNPSKRRDGITIHFYCEECGKLYKYNIIQHKGQTLMGFDFGNAAPVKSVIVEERCPNETLEDIIIQTVLAWGLSRGEE